MTAKTKTSKREAILDAMLDVAVERGLHEAPMSLVAKRAGASPGVIYHHFASKDAIIQALYERIRSRKVSSILAGYTPGMDDREAFLLTSINTYRFYRKHRKETRFLEQVHAIGLVCQPAAAGEKSEAQIAMEKRFCARSKGGVFADLPQDVIHELTMGLATRLAAAPRKLTDEELLSLAARMWTALTQ